MDKNLAREKKKRLIITFETTTAPLKLDIKGKACGIPGRTIPLPSVISAGCGLAWRAELSDRECLIAFMKEHDIRWEAMYEIETEVTDSYLYSRITGEKLCFITISM